MNKHPNPSTGGAFRVERDQLVREGDTPAPAPAPEVAATPDPTPEPKRRKRAGKTRKRVLAADAETASTTDDTSHEDSQS